MKSLADFKEVVLNSQDKNELYLTEVELQEYIGARHKAIRMAETEMDASDEKSNLGIAQSLIGICRERQQEVGNWANRVNYNFRKAAKSALTKETYQKILEVACVTCSPMAFPIPVKSEQGEEELWDEFWLNVRALTDFDMTRRTNSMQQIKSQYIITKR